MGMRTTGRCGLKSEGTGGRCSSEAFDKKRWEGIRRPSGQRMRSVTGGETHRFFIGMKARNITVKTGNLESHAKSSDKKQR